MPQPPSLSDLQRDFLAAMGDTGPSPLEAWVEARGIAPAARLGIYRNAVLDIHVGALATTFPAVRAWVGEQTFDGLATRHAVRVGSCSGNLQALGRGFDRFLAAQPELGGYPWLADLARLEWLRQEVLLSPRVDAIRVGAGLPPDTIRVQPHVRWLRAAVPVLDLWRCAQDPASAAMPALGRPQAVLLWREDEVLCMCEVAEATCTWLEAAGAGWRAAAPVPPAPAPWQPLLDHGLLAVAGPPSTAEDFRP